MASREAMLRAREARLLRFNTRLQWYGDNVLRNVNVGFAARLKAIGQLLRDKCVINISIPVVKRKSKITKRMVVIERSQEGEFPRADTTRLMKDVFWEFHEENLSVRVGSTLDYAVWLETRLHRSFLRRTFTEMADAIRIILATQEGGPVGRLPGQTLPDP